MAKIIGKIVKETHSFEKVMVMRPYGNETIVEPADDESVESILASTQEVINNVAPYARNCPTHHYFGRGTTYVTVQPISGTKRDEFIERMKELKVSGAFISRDRDFDGRVQLVVVTPSPTDPVIPADDRSVELMNKIGETMLKEAEKDRKFVLEIRQGRSGKDGNV